MLSFIARDVLQPQFQRLYRCTIRCLAVSTTKPDDVQSVSQNEHDCLVIKWSDDKVDEYPYVYLRENCRCPACYKDDRKSRTMYSPKEVNVNIIAQSASWDTKDNALKVNWEDGHTSHYSYEWLKHLSVDQAKKVTQMCYSDEFRDNHMPLQPRQMKSFYKAYFRYSELLAGRRTSFWYKMKSGDIMTVNNHRVFHGRSEYQDKGDNVRVLDTAYLDWDCVHSKIRILAEKQGLESPVD